MERRLTGIHHVTAIAGDPQGNLDFYAGVLGLRLVKRTVNYDDPNTYHLYYGDGAGNPGTLLTFFPWPDAPRGHAGTGMVTVVSLSVPQGSLGYWTERLRSLGVAHETPAARFGEEALPFRDADGLRLELVPSAAGEPPAPWERGPVPARHAVRGIHGIVLEEEGCARTAAMLTDLLGFTLAGEEGDRLRYETGDGGAGTKTDLLWRPLVPAGRVAAGSVHHVAWRTPDREGQHAWRDLLLEAGFHVTPPIDRTYFRSIYFREPGGALFEVATDLPGFLVDEPAGELGARLALPPRLEEFRERIERRLVPLRVPEAA